MKIVRIGNVTLDYGMWVEESDDSSAVISEVLNNLDGGVIVFEQLKRISRQTVTLMSKETGWQSIVTKNAIIALANASLGVTLEVQYDDGGTFNVRFRHEQPKGAVQFGRLVEAKLSDWFTGTIYLARV